MIMPACISLSMLLMLVYPFDFKRVSGWIYLTLPPYLYLVVRDLVKTGYKRGDILKAYTLFLILLPVVLAGVKNSIVQIIYGEKAGFGRTPKVDHRTAVPVTYLLAILGLFAWSIVTAYADFTSKNELHAVFAGSNALALGYGIFVLIGLKEIGQDLVVGLFPPLRWSRGALQVSHQAEDVKDLSSPPIQPGLEAGATAGAAALPQPPDAPVVAQKQEPGLGAVAIPVTSRGRGMRFSIVPRGDLRRNV
jgi:hypothetical protein